MEKSLINNCIIDFEKFDSVYQFLEMGGISVFEWYNEINKVKVVGWLSETEKYSNDDCKSDTNFYDDSIILDDIHPADILILNSNIESINNGTSDNCDITIRINLHKGKTDEWYWIRLMAKKEQNNNLDCIVGIIIDTTQQRKMLYDFSLNLSLLNSALNLSNISGLYIPISEETNSTLGNDVHFFGSLFHKFDIKAEQLIYKDRHYSVVEDTFDGIIMDEDLDKLKDAINNVIDAPGQMTQEKVRFKLTNGQMQWFKVVLIRELTPYGDGVVGAIADVDDEVKHLHIVEHEATHDKLTLAKNRSSLAQYKIKNDSDVSLIFMDLDDFKEINDLYGHNAGDLVLIRTVEKLTNLFGTEQVYRVGGDEFVIILDTPDKNVLNDLLNRTVKMVNEPIIKGNEQYKVGVSIGVSRKPSNREDVSIQDLLNEADFAMYDAKKQGKNKIEIIKESDLEKYKDRIRLENEFKTSFESKEISAIYQPVIDKSTNKIIGVEALARWTHRGKVIPANEFIDITKKYQMMNVLDTTILQLALKEVSPLIRDNIVDKDFRISVNLSTASLRTFDENLIFKIIKDSGISVKNIVFEVNEEYVSDKRVIEKLEVLKNYGFTVVLDDYSSGYTSLESLVDFNFDYVKIDHKILPNFIETSCVILKKKEMIYMKLAELINNLGIKVIAEGVETDKQVDKLLNNNIIYMQGYHFSKPVTIEVFKNEIIKKYK